MTSRIAPLAAIETNRYMLFILLYRSIRDCCNSGHWSFIILAEQCVNWRTKRHPVLD